MGLWDRIKRVFKSNINDMISKAEDPQMILNQAIIDMNEQLIESKKGVAASIADEKKLERQYNENVSQAKEWKRKAMLAVQAGKDDLAKEALLREQDYSRIAVQFKQQYDAQHETVDKLKSALRMLQGKIDEAQRKKNLLIARAKRAEAQKKIANSMSSISNNSAFDAFERMNEKVEQIEAEASAAAEIEDFSNNSSLEKEFEMLESGDAGADLLLEKLKSEMKPEGTES
jgi:phage shock protein A